MKKVRLALIGAGSIAQVAHIPNWQSMEKVELVAVCDTNQTQAKAVAERYNIARCYTKDDELLKDDTIDAVDICAPTNMHRELAINALSAGKHVLVEKPIGRNAAEAQEMVKAAEKYQKQLMVAMNARFRRDAINLKTFIDAGDLGEVFYAKCGWLRRQQRWTERSWLFQKKYSGGGVLMDLGIQMLDLAMWLLGNVPAKLVKATTFNKVAKLDVEDSAAAFIHLKDDRTLTLDVSWTFLTAQDLLYANFYGTQGGALLNPLRVMKEMHGNLINLTPHSDDSPQARYKRSYRNELRHFVDCLLGGKQMMSSGEESISRMKIIEAIYESARSGREVSL